MNFSRIKNLKRLINFSTWKWIILTVTNSEYEPLFSSMSKKNGMRFEDPIPWFAWRSLPVLAGELSERRGGELLEWGSGASTVYYARCGMKVTAYEHEDRWVQFLKGALKQQGLEADVRVMAPDEYSNPPVSPSDYSVFVIDGRERSACAEWVVKGIVSKSIRPGTLIVFDDSQRDRYVDAIEKLAKNVSRHFTYTGTTSLDLDKATTFFWV